MFHKSKRLLTQSALKAAQAFAENQTITIGCSEYLGDAVGAILEGNPKQHGAAAPAEGSGCPLCEDSCADL